MLRIGCTKYFQFLSQFNLLNAITYVQFNYKIDQLTCQMGSANPNFIYVDENQALCAPCDTQC